MLRFVALRLVMALPTLWAVLSLVFVLVRIVPGDPALVILGDQATEQALVALRHRMGLDVPLWDQYLQFMGQMLHGDLGQSMVRNRPVWGEVATVLPYTLELTFVGIFLGVVMGLPLGVLAAQHRGGWIDAVARWTSLLGLSFPAFISGILIGNSVLTEIVFNRPGLGKLIVGALNDRDYTMLQGLMVIYALVVVVANLATDLAYGAVDPRIRVR